MNFSIPWIPFVIGIVVNMGLGALWYSPALLGLQWMKAAGVFEEDVSDGSNMGAVYGLTTLTSVITSFVIGFLLLNLDSVNLITALLVAVLVWLGFNLPVMIRRWGFEGRPFELGMINQGYNLVVYVIVAVIYSFFL